MTTRFHKLKLLLSCLQVSLCLALVNFVDAQEKHGPAQDIAVQQNMGKRLPLHLKFEDDKNDLVKLGDYFRNGKPILLSFNYSDCPKLCVVQLNNLASALANIDLVPGEDFEFISVSLDPNEQASTLAKTKQKYLYAYGDVTTADGWHYLRGTKANILELTKVCGFKYKYIHESRTYSHPAAFIFITADGRISSYADGLNGKLEELLKPSLMEAGNGKIGSFADKVAYFASCFVFDPTTGKHSLSAIRVMRLAGMVTMLALAIGVGPYWFFKRNFEDSESIQENELDQTFQNED